VFATQVLNLNRRLCSELAPHALDLVEAFGLPEELLAAPIASGWNKLTLFSVLTIASGWKLPIASGWNKLTF
jgi:hypothetical protein